MFRTSLLPLLFAAFASFAASQSVTVQLPAVLDNTLYQDPAGLLSNGAGQYVFVGQNQVGLVRRALLQFDIAAAIPTKSRIIDVQLRLNASRSTAVAPVAVELRRVTTQWGEGTSVGTLGEGAGAPVTNGDASWTYGVYPTLSWTNAGGDYAAVASSTTTMPVTGPFVFGKTVELLADVQDFLDGRYPNFGWLVKTTAENAAGNARRIDGRQDTDPLGVVPQLVVTFVPPGAVESFGTGCTTSGGIPFSMTAAGIPAQGHTSTLTFQSGVPYGLYVTLLSYDVMPEPNQLDVGCYWWLRQIPYPNFGIRFHDIFGVSQEVINLPIAPALYGLPLALQSILVDWAHPRQYALSNALLVCVG